MRGSKEPLVHCVANISFMHIACDEIHFYLWWSLRVSLNDDDKRHSQCAGEMNPLLITWSWSVHAHCVVPHSLCGDDRFTQLRGGVHTHTHIHTYTYIQTYRHVWCHVMAIFPRPAWRQNPLFRGGDFHVYRMMTINVTVNA